MCGLAAAAALTIANQSGSPINGESGIAEEVRSGRQKLTQHHLIDVRLHQIVRHTYKT